LEVNDIDPSQKFMKSLNHSYTYDPNGNILSEYKRGNGAGSAKEDVHYLYDALDRVTKAHENFGNTTRLYEYDSLGNIVWERFHNGTPDYYDMKYNKLNQMTEKKIGGKDRYEYQYDLRGNLTK
jgi:YD repeat-containing protein